MNQKPKIEAQDARAAAAVVVGAKNPGNGLDLSSLDTLSAANEGAVLPLRHPASDLPLLDSAGNEITLTLAGSDSDAYRQATREAANRRLAVARRTPMTADETDVELLEILVRCTLSWRGVVMDGETLDCTPANARRLFARLPWIREQAEAFIADRANFIRS